MILPEKSQKYFSGSCDTVPAQTQRGLSVCVCVSIFGQVPWHSPDEPSICFLARHGWNDSVRVCVCVRVHMCVCSKAHFCSTLTFNWKQNIFVLRWISFYQSLNSHCLSLFLILLLFPHFFHVTFVLAPLPLSSIQFVFIYTKMNWNDYI